MLFSMRTMPWSLFMALLAVQVLFGQDYTAAPFTAFRMEEEKSVAALCFSASGKLLLAAADDGTVQCWDIERKALLTSTGLGNQPTFAGFLSGDKSLLVVDDAGTISVLDLLTGKTTVSFRAKGKPIKAALDAGRQYLAVATDEDRIQIVDIKALMPAGTIDARGKIDDLLFLGFDRLGQQLVAVTQAGNVVSWNPSTLRILREMSLAGGELHGSTSVVKSAATNRAANVFVVGLEEVALPKGGIMGGKDLMRENRVIAYDWNTGIEVKRIKTLWSVEQMALGPGNDHVVVVNDEDNNVTLVDLRKGELGSTITMEKKPEVLVVSEDNNWLAAGSEDGAVVVWSLRYKGELTVKSAKLPSLAGRIRTSSGTEPALPSGVPVRIAILTFEAKGMAQDVADICMNSLSNLLANFEYVTLVERKQIETVVKEQQFQVSDLTDEKTSVQLGKLLNADKVMVCSIGKLGTSVVLTARILSVETGKVLKGREVICEECRDQDIYDAVSMLVSTIAQ